MLDINSMKSHNNVNDFIKGKFKDFTDRKKNPNYFDPTGTLLFTGAQGEGKTLSAVLYVIQLLIKYPKALLVTNVYLRDYPVDNKRIFLFKDNDCLTKYSNGFEGVIFFIDEIQLYLNSLQSKNVDPKVMTLVSQQRKQRIHIVCTSQRLNRVAKPIREQYPNVVICKNVLNCFQVNKVMFKADVDQNGEVIGDCDHKYHFFHFKELYDAYDTYAVIDVNKSNFKGNDLKGVEL